MKLKKSDKSFYKIEKEIPILDPFPKQTKFAKIVLPTGAEYDGQFINEKPNGFGYKATEEGEKYLGDFKNGLANGFGRLYDREGILSFEGLWNEGVPSKKHLGISVNPANEGSKFESV